MRRFGIAVIIVVFFTSCGSVCKTNNEDIFVSILPLKYFTEQIVGDHFSVEVMVPPGTSPATYSPTPKQMKRLFGSSLYLSAGYLGFEKAWLGKIRASCPAIEIVNTSYGIELIKAVEQHHGDHSHWGEDPHTWVSPRQAQIIAKNIFEAVINIEPANREFYKANLHKFIRLISETEEKTALKLATAKGAKFLIFHPSLGYLARDYGLTQIAIEYEGKSPSPRYMQHIVDLAEKENIKLVLIQKEFDVDNAKSIAEEIGAEVVQIDPLSYNWPEQVLFIADILSK